MKIAILSDFHFGYAWGTERQEDSFIQAREALHKAAKANLILIAGDIFNARTPKQEIMAETLKLFSKLKFSGRESEAVLVDVKGSKSSIHESTRLGIPIVAIPGTHEKRGKNLANPVKLLEEAGYLIHLDDGTAIFELDGEKVAVSGISGVPEIYIRDKIKELNLKPVKDMLNILLIHQSIKDFVYMDAENPTLTKGDLPKGFDLIVNGHIHWYDETTIGDSILLITGSTITTQVRKTESKIPKKIFFYDTKTRKITSEDLETPRGVFYIEIDASGKNRKDIKQEVLEKLNKIKGDFKRKPLVRVRVIGETQENLNFLDIIDQYKSKFILGIKNDAQSREQKEKLKTVQDILEKEIPIDELGIKILQENANEGRLSINVSDIFELLSTGQLEEAEKELLKKPSKKPLKKKAKVEEPPEVVEEPKKEEPTFSYVVKEKGQQRLF